VLRPPVPPATGLQLALATVCSGGAGTRPAACADGLHSSFTSGQPSGSDRFRVPGSTGAHLRLLIGAPRILPTGGDPSGLRLTILVPSGLRQMALPPAGPATYLRLASDAVLWLGWLPPPDRSGCFHPPALPAAKPHGLRLAISSPAEPPMHSLFPPNLASPAEPSMSIPFPPDLASSGITQRNNFRLAPVFVNPGASSDPSRACAQGFTLCPGWRPSLRLSPAVLSVNRAGDSLPACANCVSFQLPATNSDALLGHQLKETLRPFQLWKQV